MARHYFPDHFSYRNTSWADRAKGSRPYVHPLPYHRFFARENNGTLKKDPSNNKVWPPDYSAGQFVAENLDVVATLVASGHFHQGIDYYLFHNDLNKARNKALTKIDNQLNQVTNFFEDWYERKQSYDLVTNASKEILGMLLNWRKPGYLKFMAGRTIKAKTLPEAWLTLQFGIKPLIGTIDNALHNLARPLPDVKFYETSGCSFSYDNTSAYPDLLYSRGSGTFRISYGVRVLSNPNPNLGLVNIAGLGKPFSTMFSVLPWGWAVDYFVNASEMLQNFENKHPGLNLTGWYSTEKWDIQAQQSQHHIYNLFRVQDAEMHRMRRYTNIPQPKFRPTVSFPLLGGNQAANLLSAIALSMKKG